MRMRPLIPEPPVLNGNVLFIGREPSAAVRARARIRARRSALSYLSFISLQREMISGVISKPFYLFPSTVLEKRAVQLVAAIGEKTPARRVYARRTIACVLLAQNL